MRISRLLSVTLVLAIAVPAAPAQWVQIGPPGFFSSVARTADALFAGFQGAGVYVSHDDGATWHSASTGLTTRNVTGLASIGSTVFASTAGGGVFATGDVQISWSPMNAYLISMNVGSITAIGNTLYAGPVSYGAFLSTDLGRSWEPAGKGLATGSIRTYTMLDSVLLAGTSTDGVYRSTDSGGTWTPSSEGLPSKSDVVAFATVGQTLFAAPVFDGVYRSQDRGLTWIPAASGLTNKGVTCLAPVPLPGGGARLLAGTATGGLFASGDTGATWSRVDMGISSNVIGTLVVRGSTVYAGVGEGVRVSADAGIHWGPVGSGLSNSSVNGVAVLGGKIYAGTSRSGVFVTADGGKSWQQFNQGLANNEITCLTAGPSKIYVGTTGGTVSSRAPGDESWVNGADDLSSKYINAVAVCGPVLLAAAGGEGLFYSKDGGLNWRAGAGSAIGLDGTIVTSFAFPGSTWFAGTETDGILRSLDSARTWVQFNRGLPSSGVFALTVVDSFLVAGTSDGIYVYATRDFRDPEASWKRGSADLNGCSILTFVQTGPALLAGTSDGRIFLSLDGGGRWQSVSQGLPSGPVRALATDGVDVCAGTSLAGVSKRPLAEMIALLPVPERQAPVPTELRLEQNYPNPFNPSTTVTCALPAASRILLVVYDMLGRTVETLIDGEKPAGTFAVRWDASRVPSGVYFCRLQVHTPGGTVLSTALTRKMILIH